MAQPLLLEVVYVESIRQLESLTPDIDEGGGGTRRLNGVRCIVFETKDPSEFETLLPELCSVASLTLRGLDATGLEISLPSSLGRKSRCDAQSAGLAHESILETDLSSLHLTDCRVVNVGSILLYNLCSLTLTHVDAATTAALLDPISLPRLEELAWFDTSSIVNSVIKRSSFRQLLPQIEVLIFGLHVLKTVTDAEVRSAVSRTLVDCGSHQLSDLPKSTLQPVHLRVYGLSELEEHTRLTTFSEETSKLTAYIESNPSLPLRSVYLPCDEPSTVRLFLSSQGYVEELSRVCQQRNIDLIFETGPAYLSLDPCFSPDFSDRMKEQRTKESASEV